MELKVSLKRRQQIKSYYEANKDAIKVKRKASYEKNKEKILARYREKYAADPSYAIDADYKKRYGISLAQYDEMLKAQDYKCAICKKHKDTFSRRLSVDHCHTTGKIRGLLCINCNRALGSLKDSIEAAENLIKYLKVANG